MTQRQASPAGESRGTQTKRIALTRGELIHILFCYDRDVKRAEDFTPFLDGVFANGERDGAIVFDPEAPAGERFG